MVLIEVGYSTLQLYGTTNNKGQDQVFVAGTAKVNQGSSTPGWDDFQVRVPLDYMPWSDSKVVISSVSLAGISNLHESINAGWIVDRCFGFNHKGKPHLEFRMRIREVDGHVHSVSFTAIVIGKRDPETTEDRARKGDVPTKDVPTKDVPTKDVPTKDVPTKDVPMVRVYFDGEEGRIIDKKDC